MLPRLRSGQQAFIEITNSIHGGSGWELGKRLWSPVYSKNNSQKSWKIMERVKNEDLIIHLVNQDNVYHFSGISFAAGGIRITEAEPPSPDEWANMSPYQYVELSDFFEFPNPITINHFFESYGVELRQVVEMDKSGRFYVLYGQKKQIRMAQRYLAECSPNLYRLFSSFAEEVGINVAIEFSSGSIDTSEERSKKTKRIVVETSRIIRDTAIGKLLKAQYEGRCQICNSRITLPRGGFYSEGHHIKPLGGDHSGPDIPENIIIVCPTHHAEFDHCSIAIDPNTFLIKHIDKDNPYHNQHLAYRRDNLGSEFLEYHYRLFETGCIQKL